MKSVFELDRVPFEQRLAEAIAWARPRASAANAEDSLRSEELRPWALSPDRESAVLGVVQNRAARLRPVPVAARAPRALAGGRLLVYCPDLNLADGAATDESRGFFDPENTPPWDAWIALGREPDHDHSDYRTYLITWVPDVLMDLAGQGIDVNPEECICWLEHAPIAARDELRAFLRRV